MLVSDLNLYKENISYLADIPQTYGSIFASTGSESEELFNEIRNSFTSIMLAYTLKMISLLLTVLIPLTNNSINLKYLTSISYSNFINLASLYVICSLLIMYVSHKSKFPLRDEIWKLLNEEGSCISSITYFSTSWIAIWSYAHSGII